jgi:hypothetical protein
MVDEEKVRYSNLEMRILKNIPEDGTKISTIELVNRCYTDENRPRNARASILHVTNVLKLKVDDNKEDFKICKSERAGAQPIYFWRKPRRK